MYTEIRLACFLDSYSCLKDNRPLEPKSNVLLLEKGIKIDHLSHFDEGIYQCKAENQYGVSLSNTTLLRRAYVGTYGSPTANDYHGLEEGQPYVLRFKPLKCFPPPTFSWQIAESMTDNSPRGLVTSKRVQIDDEGMVFSWQLPKFPQST